MENDFLADIFDFNNNNFHAYPILRFDNSALKRETFIYILF